VPTAVAERPVQRLEYTVPPPPTDGAPPLAPAPAATTADTSTGTTAGATADPAVSAPALPVGAALDELVRRLFDPLSARLKDELRLDRERAGVISDLRH
jgi:hypothetical protein